MGFNLARPSTVVPGRIVRQYPALGVALGLGERHRYHFILELAGFQAFS